MQLTDSQIIERTLCGDDTAFDALVSRYRAYAYRLALSKVRSRETAMDIAQEAFIQAYTALRTLREPEKFRIWLAVIVANACKTYLRRPSDVLMTSEVMDALENSVSQGEPNASAAFACEALDRLPDGTRSAAILFFIEEMKQVEIAEFLGISIAAVKARVRDARSRLRKEMIDMVRHTAKKGEPGEEFNVSMKHSLELARWYREFSDMIRSGVHLMDGFKKLLDMGFSEPISDATRKLMAAIESGSTFSDALQDLPALTTPEAVGLVRAGEVSGELAVTSSVLADCVEAQSVVKDVEVAYLCRSLGAMLASGVAIGTALKASAEVAQTTELKRATLEISDAICAGKPVRSVLEKYPEVFPPVLVAAIVAGESSAILDHTLMWAAGHLATSVCSRLSSSAFQFRGYTSEKLDGSFAEAATNLLSDHSPVLRAGSATVLGQLGSKSVAREVSKLLTDESPMAREEAIKALAGLGCKESSDDIIGCLQDSAPAVRRAAIQALVDLNAKGATPAIAQMIGDPDQRTASTAIKALESTGQMVEWALTCLSHEDELVRIRAAHILRYNPTPEATDALIRALDDEAFVVGVISALALANMDRNEALPKLIKLLESPYHSEEAAKALAQLGDSTAAPHIRKAIEMSTLGESFLWTAEKLEGK